MEAFKDEETGNFEYELDLEHPYGTFETSIFFKSKPKENEQEDQEMKPLIDTERQYVFIYYDPKPISIEE